MSATPIPEAAQPMAELIRELVPRPQREKVTQTPMGRLRFGALGSCPAGMLPFATHATPCGLGDFEISARRDLSEDALDAFISWWDSQRDPIAAMDAVWGPVGGAHDLAVEDRR